MQHVVIVGASLAGLRAAEAVRKGGAEERLTLIGDEVHAPYTRPPLSKQLLAGDMAHEKATLRHQLECDWRLGVSATALDTGAKELTLSDGETLSYDGLVIATGCAARPWHAELPPIEGLVTLRSLDDAVALQQAVRDRPPVVVVGAGFIGCEVAATLRGLGVPVTLVDIASQPMLPVGPEIGGLLADIHRDNGVDLRLGVGVASFDAPDGRLASVTLTDGATIPAGVALIATGARPNVAWLEGSGLTLDDGIVCDEHCFAIGVEDVACAGDVARWPHPLAGGALVRVEHWTNAVEMGRTAGRNLVAAPDAREPYVAVPTFWSDQYGLKLQSAGFLDQVPQLEVVEGSLEERKFVAVGQVDDRIAAVVAMNMVRRVVALEQRIAERAPLAEALAF